MMRSANWKLTALALLTLAFVPGCIHLGGHAALQGGLPPFSEILQKAPPLQAGHARIVFYYPYSLAINLLSLDSPDDVLIENERHSLKSIMVNQRGFYCDTPAGAYSVGIYGMQQTLRITAEPGKTYYLKREKDSKTGLAAVEEFLALSDIDKGDIRASVRYNILMTVPQTEYRWSASATSASGPTTENGYGKLIVFRSSYFPNNLPLKIGLDSKTGFPLWNNEYCTFLAPEGRHALTYSIHLPLRSEDSLWHGCKVEIKKGQTTYVRFYNDNGLEAHEITPQEAAEYLQKYKPGANSYLVLKP
jgi:hypothetical protein